MCGRITLSTPAKVVAEHFGLNEIPRLSPRYNVAPGQPVAVVRSRSEGPERILAMHTWGLVPRFAKDPTVGSRLINARAETVATRPAFRDAFRQRRCLVPADGFYEWQPRGRNPKQPYHITPVAEALFAIAGLFERDTCTLLTTEANEPMRAVHARMPVLLPREAWEPWLDPERDPDRLLALLVPSPADALELHPVGLRVNDPRNDDVECTRRLPEGGLFPELFSR
ncbi:MAG: SOS response-associated peptidase [Myxococcota bacterium]